MANNPKKMKDPTDQALNAIQEVLSTTDQPSGRTEPAMDQASAPPREATRRGRRDVGAAAVEKELFDSSTADDMRAGNRAANDDRQSIGQIPVSYTHLTLPTNREV